uniref:Keratin n=1 Tax=Chelydra serpentina TaxID=8475 RepID=A0A8C3XRN3_CHESE
MSYSGLCYPECGVARPSPVTGSCNEPCVRQCPDSEVIIRPSPVVVTIPGPILSNFPQQSEVGAVGAPVVGPGHGGTFGLGGYAGVSCIYYHFNLFVQLCTWNKGKRTSCLKSIPRMRVIGRSPFGNHGKIFFLLCIISVCNCV